jgi:hypothetical protein
MSLSAYAATGARFPSQSPNIGARWLNNGGFGPKRKKFPRGQLHGGNVKAVLLATFRREPNVQQRQEIPSASFGI